MQDEVRQFGWEVQLVAITAFADKAVLTRVRKKCISTVAQVPKVSHPDFGCNIAVVHQYSSASTKSKPP